MHPSQKAHSYQELKRGSGGTVGTLTVSAVLQRHTKSKHRDALFSPNSSSRLILQGDSPKEMLKRCSCHHHKILTLETTYMNIRMDKPWSATQSLKWARVAIIPTDRLLNKKRSDRKWMCLWLYLLRRTLWWKWSEQNLSQEGAVWEGVGEACDRAFFFTPTAVAGVFSADSLRMFQIVIRDRQ